MMDWNKLLSTKRLGRTNDQAESQTPRTNFTRDYDRIIFSSAFRRLQDKTQVFPLAKSDYVRTRLTPQSGSCQCRPLARHACRRGDC